MPDKITRDNEHSIFLRVVDDTLSQANMSKPKDSTDQRLLTYLKSLDDRYHSRLTGAIDEAALTKIKNYYVGNNKLPDELVRLAEVRSMRTALRDAIEDPEHIRKGTKKLELLTEELIQNQKNHIKDSYITEYDAKPNGNYQRIPLPGYSGDLSGSAFKYLLVDLQRAEETLKDKKGDVGQAISEYSSMTKAIENFGKPELITQTMLTKYSNAIEEFAQTNVKSRSEAVYKDDATNKHEAVRDKSNKSPNIIEVPETPIQPKQQSPSQSPRK